MFKLKLSTNTRQYSTVHLLAVVPDEGDLLALYPQEPEDVLNSGSRHFFVHRVPQIELVADPLRLVLPLGIATRQDRQDRQDKNRHGRKRSIQGEDKEGKRRGGKGGKGEAGSRGKGREGTGIQRVRVRVRGGRKNQRRVESSGVESSRV